MNSNVSVLISGRKKNSTEAEENDILNLFMVSVCRLNFSLICLIYRQTIWRVESFIPSTNDDC